VSLWESVRRLCALRSDTIVQYAAYLTSSNRKMKEGTVSFDSDYSGEAGRSFSFFLGTSIYTAKRWFKGTANQYAMQEIPDLLHER
jgi:hypothetical protein